jgi:hypothetical protein
LYASKMEEAVPRRVGGGWMGARVGGDDIGVVCAVGLRGSPSVWYV